jgi:hypothetical protein
MTLGGMNVCPAIKKAIRGEGWPRRAGFLLFFRMAYTSIRRRGVALAAGGDHGQGRHRPFTLSSFGAVRVHDIAGNT